MKLKSFCWLILVVALLVLGLFMVACNPAGESAPTLQATSAVVPEEPSSEEVETETNEQPDTETDDPVTGAAQCPEAAPGTHLLLDGARGICFLYPDHYDVTQGEDGSYTLYVRSLLNTEAPLASFHFELAGGQSLGDIAAQQLVSYSLPESDIYDVTVDGVPGIMLDNFPGQDTNRRLLLVHNDQVIDLLVARIGADYGPVGEQAEDLYTMIVESFRFIPVVAEAPLQAGPECPVSTEGTNLYRNVEDGFCLLLPDGYAVDDSLTTTDGGAETAIYVGSLLDTAHPRLFITLTDAEGRSLDEITQARLTELETDLPGYEISWSFGYMLDGVAANQFERLPGQDLSRQVIAVHDGRVYSLTFIPDDPTTGDVYAAMESLYDLVMDSFSFVAEPISAGTDEDPLLLARRLIDQAMIGEIDQWLVESCDGSAPFLCISNEGENIGYAELLLFPLSGYAPDHPVRQAVAELPRDVFTFSVADEEEARQALSALVEEYTATIMADRAVTTPENTITPLGPEEARLGRLPALAFGFVHTNPAGEVQERYLNVAGFEGGFIYWLGIHYDPAGVSSFLSDAAISEFAPTFYALAAAMPIP